MFGTDIALERETRMGLAAGGSGVVEEEVGKGRRGPPAAKLSRARTRSQIDGKPKGRVRAVTGSSEDTPLVTTKV